jgi:hypothetical protein
MVVVQMSACRRDQPTTDSDHVSWFEPLAGITSHHHGSWKAPQQTEGPGSVLGSRTAGGMSGQLSPAIRERACPRPGLDLGIRP